MEDTGTPRLEPDQATSDPDVDTPALPDIASGDVLEMNPLTSQPQRSKPREGAASAP